MREKQTKPERNMKPNLPELPERPAEQATALTKLLQIIGYTQDTEISCDEVEQILDQFTELVQRGEDIREVMPLVKHHIDMCPECREEYEALLRTFKK
jgi:hypothetical protein